MRIETKLLLIVIMLSYHRLLIVIISQVINSYYVQVTELFSQECSRFKDLIHTHSYNYDFHVRSIHSIVMGRLKVEGELDLRNLLNKFCNNYVNPPHYIRNRIYSGM